jgi:hypothetical protein
MEMTRREFMQAIAGVAPAAHVSRGKGETPSPHCLGKYPGEVVPMGDIRKQSKWSG